jgi:precorrin-6B methylase 2
MPESITDAASAADHPDPSLVFRTLNAHQQSAALRGAIELDLFTAIAEGVRTPATLATRLGADARATRILCDFLVVHGFLTKKANGYGLTPTAAEFLDRRSPKCLGTAARFINSPDLLNAFRDVAELVRRGTTLLDSEGATATEYGGWVEFARSMVPMIMPAAEFIGRLAAERMSGAIRVLDIAAGHGMFGITVARNNPEARITALDWDPVLQVASENAARAGIQERYTLLPGDALRIEYDGPYELVLATNFFHHFDPDTCRSVMRKIAESLAKNGVVITLEFIPNEDRVSPPEAATFSLMMLGTTPAGDAYTFTEYQAMWNAAGLTKHELIDVPDSPQRVIVSRK